MSTLSGDRRRRLTTRPQHVVNRMLLIFVHYYQLLLTTELIVVAVSIPLKFLDLNPLSLSYVVQAFSLLLTDRGVFF